MSLAQPAATNGGGYDALLMSGSPSADARRTVRTHGGQVHDAPRRQQPVTSDAAKLERRIATASEAALTACGFVTPIDVLTGLGWLDPAQVERWRRARIGYLERVATVNLRTLVTALRLLHRWASNQGLTPSETVYVAWTRDRHRLRFTATGDQNVERAYRTHWVSPHLAAAKRARRASDP